MVTTDTSPADLHSEPAPLPGVGATLRAAVADCIRRHLDGDPDAMADLTRQVTPWLHHVLRPYRLARHTADDVVQSTLLLALLHLREVRDPASGLSWLSVVVRREALRVIQVERRYIPVDELPLPHAAPATAEGTEEIVLTRLSHAVVRRTFSKLPLRHRMLLERAVNSDRPGYARISRELQMPLGSIGPTRRRCLERMRRMLADDPEWDASA
jgi:DNA-directed RNA polymerase specialized sigma24 family protein